jgi:hypothetical protein
MYKGLLTLTILAGAAVAPASAQTYQRRATFISNGNPNGGKCTVEVVVDGVAEVEIRGDEAFLRNVAGQPPQWRRFECTGRIPDNPANFRFQGVDGRGRQQLLRDPRNGGAAVVRIEDPEGGAEAYTFDIFWNGGNGSGYGYNNGPQAYRFSREQAVDLCRNEVRERANRRFGTDINFRNINIDDNGGRRDWVVGTFDTRDRYGRCDVYQFSCAVNFADGSLRSVNIDPYGPANRGRSEASSGYSERDRSAVSDDEAIGLCRDAVRARVQQDGFGYVEFGSTNIDDRAGWSDRVTGSARGSRGGRSDWYDFACRVNLNTGSVRSVDLTRH